uniref:Receptor ligand binding region domain-containing protein n=1 Tax=Lutzomyia longipalpis TaxID=7200 RepID=A0A1B0GL55_LUTLO
MWSCETGTSTEQKLVECHWAVQSPSSGFLDFAISMRPNYHEAIIDTIRFYGWKKIIYVYDSHDGLLRLQQIYQGLQPGNQTFQVETVKRISNASEAIEFLRVLENVDRWSRKYIVLDCSTDMAKEIIVNHVRDISLGRRTYHYLLSGLIMDDRWETEVQSPSSGFLDFAISMRPNYHEAIIDTIRFYGWKKIIYVYDSHDGLLRLQQIYQGLQPGNQTFQVETVKRISNASEAIAFLRVLENVDRWSRKYIVLDCSTDMAKEIIVNHVRDISLGRRTYHYLLSGLIMDDRWETEVIEYGAINITGFRIVDTTRRYVRDFLEGWKKLDPATSQGAGKESISAQAALMYDAVFVLVELSIAPAEKPDQFRSYTTRRSQPFTPPPIPPPWQLVAQLVPQTIGVWIATQPKVGSPRGSMVIKFTRYLRKVRATKSTYIQIFILHNNTIYVQRI